MYAGVPTIVPACVSDADSRDGVGLICVHAAVRSAVRGDPRLAEDLGQAPVHDLDLAEGPDHDVGGFEVPVDDVVGMRVADRLADRLEDSQQPAVVGGRIGTELQNVGEGAPLDQLHGQERPAVRQHADLVHGGDAGVLQLAGDAGLVAEALGGRRIGRVFRGQHLDGDVAVEGGVAGAVDHAHAAAADLVEQLIAGRAGGGGHRFRDVR
jgi:hypothetical protein